MEDILIIDSLVKRYGKKQVLNGLSLNIKSGKIVGLLGPNGSGKTTLIKLTAGLLTPDSGKILIDGKIPGTETKKIVSYLPDKDFLYSWMKIRDAVVFFKDFFSDFDEKRAYEMIEFMKLDPTQKVTELSKGMLERLNLSLIMSRRAKLYLLDEPLAAVDPLTREKLINTILENFNPDSSVIISTHLVSDIERIFDEVAFINEGMIILHEEVDKLRNEKEKSMEELFKEVFA